MMSMSLLEILKRVNLEKLLPEASKLLGETAARQLVFKIVKDATYDLAKEGEVKVGDVCDVVKEVYSDLVKGELAEQVSCERKGDGEFLIKIKGCPVSRAIGKATPSGCIVLNAILAGLIEAVFDKHVMVEGKYGRFGFLKAPVKVRNAACVLDGHEYCSYEVRSEG